MNSQQVSRDSEVRDQDRVDAQHRYFEFDPAITKEKHDQEPFEFKHLLADHPLMRLEELAKLVCGLDRDKIEFNCSDLGIDMADKSFPSVPLDPEEVIRQIETCGAWMVIKDPRVAPAYQNLLNATLREAAANVGMEFSDMLDIRAFIFVSSPNSTVPFHIDGELNFFVQCHGEKTFAAFDNRDHYLVSAKDEEHDLARTRYRPYEPKFESRATVFELGPGDGCFIPLLWPHWVSTGANSYSISVAFTYKSPAAYRVNMVNLINPVLRKLGLNPSPPGVSPWKDVLKHRAALLGERCLAPIRRNEKLRAMVRAAIFGKQANYYYGDQTVSKSDD